MAQDTGNQLEPNVPDAAETAASEQDAPARAISARKPGVVGRSLDSAKDLFDGVPTPRWDIKTFLYVLVGLVVIVLLARNWAPVRVDIFGWHLDWPAPVWFTIDAAIGFGLCRLWQRYGPGR